MEISWSTFRKALLDWYNPANRPMPWKGIRDPYKIWLSEVILQQTRVEQGLPYYNKFVQHYPTVTDLAAAPDDEVMKLWEGLGYYSRARNLLKAARMVSGELAGKFPGDYNGLRALPGVGDYTAAAIGSFAYDLPTPVLDGNVFRILARYTNSDQPIDDGAGKRYFRSLVEDALGGASARTFNQAIMDFGATVCTPKRASCAQCPLAASCRALAADKVYELPVKRKTLKRTTRYFQYLVLRDDGDNCLVKKREGKDIWRGLYEFPLVETEGPLAQASDLAVYPGWPSSLSAGELNFLRSSLPFKQQLTHQTIVAVFHEFSTDTLPTDCQEYQLAEYKMLDKIALPRVITRFLSENRLHLDLF
jgi:A/G-specific adenine glycosylase